MVPRISPKNSINYTYTNYNSGICTGMNFAKKQNLITFYMHMMIFILYLSGPHLKKK